jgi:hypothetical protein
MNEDEKYLYHGKKQKIDKQEVNEMKREKSRHKPLATVRMTTIPLGLLMVRLPWMLLFVFGHFLLFCCVYFPLSRTFSHLPLFSKPTSQLVKLVISK